MQMWSPSITGWAFCWIALTLFSCWLTGSEDAGQSLDAPWPDGLLHIEQADDVDWSDP